MNGWRFAFLVGFFGFVLFPSAGLAQPQGESQYVGGSEPCRLCHPSQFDSFSATSMGKLFLKEPRDLREALACEACHGPSAAHVASAGTQRVSGFISFTRRDPTPVEQRNAVCLQCHEKTARLYWQGSPHESRNVACTDCHTVMHGVSPRFQLAKATLIETCTQCHTQRRAQLMRSSHMPLREGKLDCATCHNAHGSGTEKLLKANSINEVCYTCHAEKRGPFLWEHAPVTESCVNCHEPHGTNHEKLLKISKPRLCQQCHMVTAHRTEPHTAQAAYVFNRSCTNCHSQIHGTNHPSGTRLFQR